MNVLVVDDDAVDREIIRRSLRTSDCTYNVDEASEVDSALAKCNEKKYDLILIDYLMPKNDGMEFIREIKDRYDLSVVIVMISNYEDEEISLRCLQEGAQDFLLKGEVTASKLKRTIHLAKIRFELEQKLKESFYKAKKLSEKDALTDLANRYFFEESFKTHLANNKRDGGLLSVVCFDLDKFKYINDSYGHHVGDILLQKVSMRVQSTLRGDELFARIGGDEFAIVLANLRTINDPSKIAKRIARCMQKPFIIDGHKIAASVSIGISTCFGKDKYSANDLIRYADIAMYRSKSSGRGKINYFEDDMHNEFVRKVDLENGLESALVRDELSVRFQPIYCSSNMDLYGFEALLRWNLNGSSISPKEFIPISEDSGHIISIGRYVIEQSVKQLSECIAAINKNLGISINLSAKQLLDEDLPIFVKDVCLRYGIDLNLVEFEITETALLDPSSKGTDVLKKLVEAGCKLSLDDFGTGFSSISHLQNLPISTVKLDRSIMPVSHLDSKNIALFKGLVAMLKALDLDVVAEGVETAANELFCREVGVDRLQGFYYSAALEPNVLVAKNCAGY